MFRVMYANGRTVDVEATDGLAALLLADSINVRYKWGWPDATAATKL